MIEGDTLNTSIQPNVKGVSQIEMRNILYGIVTAEQQGTASKK